MLKREVPSIRTGTATTPAQDQQRKLQPIFSERDKKKEVNDLLVHLEDICNAERVKADPSECSTGKVFWRIRKPADEVES